MAAEGDQELSFEAPEDDEMELDSTLPIETSNDLKPRVITGGSAPDAIDSQSTPPKEKVLASDEDIKKLRGLFDVSEDIDVSVKKVSNLRLNTIHVRGVQELSSDEVLKYFELYDPASLEWVNDLTCNVVFDDPKAAATAMIGVMAGFVEAKKEGETPGTKDLSGITVIDPSTLEVPVPPDNWIVGKQHPKSKALLLRIATVNDKKIQGAGKYSEFYRKHGNPHYGGRKNLISKSLAEKLAKNPKALEEGLPEEELSLGEDLEPVITAAPRKLRMKMRADEEEEAKVQNILISIPNSEAMERDLLDDELDEDIDREVHVEKNKKSIWDRLGPKRGGGDYGDRNEWGLSTRSRGISRSGESRDRASVFSRLSFGPSEGRDRPSYKPSQSRNVVYSNLRIKK